MRLRRARIVSGETPAAAAESLHAKPCAMRSTSARSAGVRVEPSRYFAVKGARISTSMWGMGRVLLQFGPCWPVGGTTFRWMGHFPATYSTACWP